MRVRISSICVAFLFVGCASSPAPNNRVNLAQEDIDALLADQVFLERPVENDVADIDLFELPAPIERFLDDKIVPLPTEEERYRALQRWVFAEADKYEYDPDTTVTIAQLEEVGKINCFSFSNLFVAAARHVGIPAQVQLVYSPPDWNMSDRTWLLTQHINVTGEIRKKIDYGEFRESARLPRETGTVIRSLPSRHRTSRYVVDLNPEVVVDAYRTQLLEDHEVLARYYANVGVEAMLQDDYDKAYMHTRKAINADNYSAPAWNNLGVLYARADQDELARRSFLTALQIDPDADSAMANLAALHHQLGNEHRAAELNQKLAERRDKNPYYHFYLGEDLLEVGRYEESIEQFRQAIRIKKDEELFYLALAEAQLALNRLTAAEKNLKKAQRYTEVDNAERYSQLNQALLESEISQEN
jgi:tetratricopeptide (TPR) repeat protein